MEGLILLIILALAYFTPSIVAGSRGHGNVTPIVLVNIFLGWTVLGWFAALVWSTTNNITARPVRSVADRQDDKDLFVLVAGVILVIGVAVIAVMAATMP